MNTHDLKAMQVQLAKLEAEHRILSDEVKEKQKQFSHLKSRIDELKNRISSAQDKNSMPIISEHAMLRLLERVYGFDLDELKKKVLTDSVVSIIKFGKSGEVPLPVGGRAVYKNNVIVSIV